MIPITELYVFDTTGLFCIVKFKNNNFEVQVDWPEDVSLRGAKFVAHALRYKSETGRNILKASKNLIAFIGDNYILSARFRKISHKDLAKVLEKTYNILSAVKSFDPNEIGEVVAKAVIAEFSE